MKTCEEEKTDADFLIDWTVKYGWMRRYRRCPAYQTFANSYVSRRIQQMVLPSPQELQQIPGLDIVGYMQPADEVGGDYYDVLRNNGVLHIGIGDVTGHGLESGILMLMTQTAIRTLLEHGETDPVAFVTTLNRTIYQHEFIIQSMQILKTTGY